MSRKLASSARISTSSNLSLSVRESTNSTAVCGYCFLICSATSRASRSGRFRSSNTLSQETCRSRANACAPPTASSRSAVPNAGFFISRCRKAGSALATRMRLRKRRKLEAAVAAMDVPHFRMDCVNQSALICATRVGKFCRAARRGCPCDFITKDWRNEMLQGLSLRRPTGARSDPSRDCVPLRNTTAPASSARVRASASRRTVGARRVSHSSA